MSIILEGVNRDGCVAVCPRLLLLVQVVEKDADLVVSLLHQHVQSLDFRILLRGFSRIDSRGIARVLPGGADGFLSAGCRQHDRAATLLAIQLLVEVAEVVEALVDHEAVR